MKKIYLTRFIYREFGRRPTRKDSSIKIQVIVLATHKLWVFDTHFRAPFPTQRLPLASCRAIHRRRHASVDTMYIEMSQCRKKGRGTAPFFPRYYGRVGLLLHLHSASTHAATGYWPYDMLTNIPVFSKEWLSTLPRFKESLQEDVLFILSIHATGRRCTIIDARFLTIL